MFKMVSFASFRFFWFYGGFLRVRIWSGGTLGDAMGSRKGLKA